MPQIIDLEAVLISPQVLAAWHALAKKYAGDVSRIVKRGVQIPIEHGEIDDDGNLFIVVSVENEFRISLPVPQGQWQWNN